MTERKPDRRTARTRKHLSAALIELILEKGYDAVTITDIAERANLRRATFYLHYRDKEDLLLATLGASFDQLAVTMAQVHTSDPLAGKATVEPYRALFEHVDANSSLYRIVLNGQGGAAVSRRIRESLAGLVLQTLNSLPREQIAIPPDVLAQFIAGAEWALVTWWLEQDKPYSAEQMAQFAYQLVLDGVRGVLEMRYNG